MYKALTAIVLAMLALPASSQTLDLTDRPDYPHILTEPAATIAGRDMVLLSSDLVEIAVALGAADRIVARPDAIALPEVADTPVKMREKAGVEGVAALRPSLVIGSSVIQVKVLDGLAQLGIRTEMVDRTLPALEKVGKMAAILGLEAGGMRLQEAIKADYARAGLAYQPQAPLRILHASKQGAGGNFSVGGLDTAVHNLIERVGAENAAAAIGMDRYRSATAEGVMIMAPDVVIISEAETRMFGDLDNIWTDYPGLSHTPAGRNKRLIIMKELHVRDDAASSGIATLALAEALAEMFP